MKKINIDNTRLIFGALKNIDHNRYCTSITVTDQSFFTMDGCLFYPEKVISENIMLHSGHTGSFKWNGEIIKVFPYLNSKGECIGSMYIY